MYPILKCKATLSFFLLFIVSSVFSQPLVSSLTPASATVGSVVTINGSGFSPYLKGNTVYFGGVKAVVLSSSATSIKVVVPVGASYQPVAVTTNKLTGYSRQYFTTTFNGDNSLSYTSFAGKVSIPGAQSLNSIDFCDLDGDGKQDMLTTTYNVYNTKMSVLRNTSSNGSFSFDSRIDYVVPAAPYNFTTGDLDGDGLPEVITCNDGANNLTVFKNNSKPGSIALSISMNLPVVSRPYKVVARDFDGDGRVDLAIVNAAALTLSIYRNITQNGVMAFDPIINFPTANAPYDLASGDIDGDGKADLVTANYSSNSISVFRNTSISGKISFATKVDFTAGAYTTAVAIADYNNDGQLDVASICSNGVSVFKNTSSTANISFANKTDYILGSDPNGNNSAGIVNADFNGDGMVDILSANGSPNTLGIIKNTSTANDISFASFVEFPFGTYPQGVAACDVDGDGKIDIAGFNSYVNTVPVLRNLIGDALRPIISSFSPESSVKGSSIIILGAHFTGTTAVSVGSVPVSSFTVLDDNSIRVVIDESTSGNISVTTPYGTASKGGFTYIAPAPTITSFAPANAHIGDEVAITGTGFGEATSVSFGGKSAASFYIVSANEIRAIVDTGLTGEVSVTSIYGKGYKAGFTFIPPAAKISSFTPATAKFGANVQIKGTAFSNATGVSFGGRTAFSFKVISDSEIVAQVGDCKNGNVVVYVPGDSAVAGGFTYIAPPLISSFSPASGTAGSTVTINGDNFNDDPAANLVYFGGAKAVVSAASRNSLKVMVPFAATHQPISVTSNNLTAFSNKPFDVLFSGADTSFSNYSFSTDILKIPVNELSRQCRVADLDGDGKLDIVVLNSGGVPPLTVYRNTTTAGNIAFGDKLSVTTASSLACFFIADIDGDGLLDIIAPTYGSNNQNVVSIFRNKSTVGKLAFDSRVDMPASVAFDDIGNLVVSDIDGDGKSDLCFGSVPALCALRNASTPGVISFETMKQFPMTSSYGGKSIVATDFDGDGLKDIILTDYSGTMTAFRNISSAGIIAFDNPIVNTLNEDPWGIAASDLNNDGKMDLVTINKLKNTFTIFKNTSIKGVFSQSASTDRSTGSAPMALDVNDFDGDGKPDLAVANNVDNTISLLKNRTQGDSVILGQANNYSTGDSPYSIASGDLSGDGQPDMVVVNRGGNTMWIYKNRVSAPALYSFTPTAARTGSTVFIYGRNLTGTTSVKFGNTEATSFTVVGDTLIKAIVGSGSSGSIAVNNQYDTGLISGFTFTTLPDVVSYYPVRGTTGTSVEIKGSNFSNASFVSFGKFKATSFEINSDTSITAIVGDIVPGTSPVIVGNASGKDSLNGFYTGVFFTSFTPSSGPIGTTVTINGTNFSTTVDDDIVFFGGVRAQVLSATNTSLTVKVPASATNQYISASVKGSTAYSSSPFAVTFGKGGLDFNNSSFKSQTLTGVNAYNSYISDLDGDGKLDLILVSGVKVFLYKNTSVNDSISFASPDSITLPHSASAVCATDLNADGKPDLSITIGEAGYSSLSVWTNTSSNGKISFQFEGYNYRTGISGYESAQNSAVNDLDGDGIPDIAVINGSENFVIYYTSNNSGKLVYNGPVGFPKSGPCHTSYLCDLDGDGKPEMITTNILDNKVSISKNISSAGHILFARETVYPSLNGPAFVSVGDVDGDGKPDIAIGNGNYDYITSFSIMRNTSTLNNLSFDPMVNVETGERVKAMAMSDVDGDGKPDLTVCYDLYSNDSLSLYRNTSKPGAISFASRVDYLIGAGPMNNLMGDLNGDGKPEIIVTNFESGSVTILKNQLASFVPSITSFSPESGSLKKEVIIKGSRFSNATAIAFGDVPAISFRVISDSEIVAVVGSGATGDVSVTTNEGVAIKAGFKYISSPVSLYSFTPVNGTKGTQVTIKGANLTNVTFVAFGGVAASSFKIVADTLIDAVVGIGASGSVEVKTSDAETSLTGFTYLKPIPQIFSFSPASAAMGETVRIVGAGFDSALSVNFGDVAASSFKIVSDSVITAVVGRGASGNINITIAEGKVSLAGFVYLAPKPQIASFAPTSAMLGTTVIIKGSGFSDASSVSFGGTAAFSFEVISDSVIKAVVGSGASGNLQVATKTDTTSLNGFIYISQQLNDAIQVYPNPSINGFITVNHPSIVTTSQIIIVDMNGNIAKKISIVPNTEVTKVDVSSLVKGIYRIIWSDGQQKTGLTVLIQ